MSGIPIGSSSLTAPQQQPESVILSGGYQSGLSVSPITYRPSSARSGSGGASKSLPNSWSSMPSTLSKIKARRRQSQDTEFAFYERISGMGYSEEEDSDEDSHSASASDDQSNAAQQDDEMMEEDNLPEMELDTDSTPGQQTPSTTCDSPASTHSSTMTKKKSAKAKGKARAVSTGSVGGTRMTAEDKMRKKKEERKAERRASLNARKPVITLRKDSGWSFSQSALMPPHVREQYSLCDSTTSAKPTYGNRYGHRNQDYDSEEENYHQVHVTEIRVTPQESKAILP